MYDNMKMNQYGFYSLKDVPTDEERENYYKNKYYQNDSSSYTIKYTAQEQNFFKAKLEQKQMLIERHLPTVSNNIDMLDIGCGEGFAVAFFTNKGYRVTGLDYSDAGIKNHNSDILEKVIIGDVYDSISKLIRESRSFDVINMDNILEHVTDPLFLLKQVCLLLKANGIVVIKVPNEFSVLHRYFLENEIVAKPRWVVPLDHISYFNKDGLINICQDVGLKNLDILGNYMTEFFVLNPNTNYYENTSVGKSCHLARVAQENIFHTISPQKTIELYRILGDMGLGREIIGIFKKESVD